MSAIRTDRPRNAAINKDRVRVEYAARRLEELQKIGLSRDYAWEVVRSELRAGKAK